MDDWEKSNETSRPIRHATSQGRPLSVPEDHNI